MCRNIVSNSMTTYRNTTEHRTGHRAIGCLVASILAISLVGCGESVGVAQADGPAEDLAAMPEEDETAEVETQYTAPCEVEKTWIGINAFLIGDRVHNEIDDLSADRVLAVRGQRRVLADGRLDKDWERYPGNGVRRLASSWGGLSYAISCDGHVYRHYGLEWKSLEFEDVIDVAAGNSTCALHTNATVSCMAGGEHDKLDVMGVVALAVTGPYN